MAGKTTLILGGTAVAVIVGLALTIFVARQQFPEPEISPFTISPEKVLAGEESEISWRVEYAESCVAVGDNWQGAWDSKGGKATVAQEVEGEYTYDLRCIGPGGETTASVSQSVAKSYLSVTYPPIIDEGRRALISWDASELSSSASCRALGFLLSQGLSLSGTAIFGPMGGSDRKILFRCEDDAYSEEKEINIRTRPSGEDSSKARGSFIVLPREEPTFSYFFEEPADASRYTVRAGTVVVEPSYSAARTPRSLMSVRFDRTEGGELNTLNLDSFIGFDDYTQYFECGVKHDAAGAKGPAMLREGDRVEIARFHFWPSGSEPTFVEAINRISGCSDEESAAADAESGAVLE